MGRKSNLSTIAERVHPLFDGAGAVQWKVAPALAAGCTCILKPSEVCSVTCLEMAAIMADVGMPGGVFNVLTGLGTTAGAALRYPLPCLPCLHGG